MSDSIALEANTATHTADTPQLLLEHHLKELRLPTILREYPGSPSTGLRRWGGSTTRWHDSVQWSSWTIHVICCA